MVSRPCEGVLAEIRPNDVMKTLLDYPIDSFSIAVRGIVIKIREDVKSSIRWTESTDRENKTWSKSHANSDTNPIHMRTKRRMLCHRCKSANHFMSRDEGARNLAGGGG